MARFPTFLSAHRLVIVLVGVVLIVIAMVLVGQSKWRGVAPDHSLVRPQEISEPAFQPSNLDPWPSFRGNAARTGVANTSLPAKLHLVWKYDTKDAIDSTAAIVDGRVYVGTDSGRLLCLDLSDGKLIWEFTEDHMGAIFSSPCVANGRVFFGDYSGHVYAIDATSGRKVWSVALHDEVISSPIAVDNVVVVGSYDYTLNCFDAATGQSKWSFRTDAQVHASPAFLKDSVLIAGCDGYLRTILLKNGEEQSTVSLGGPCAASPAVLDGRVYLGMVHGECLCVDLGKGEVDWQVPAEEDGQHEIETSAAVVAGEGGGSGGVIFGSKDGRVFRLSAKTGQMQWTFTAKGAVESSPTVAGGRVFFGSDTGQLYGLDVRTGARVWDYALGGGIHSSPALGEGRLVVGNKDALFCFGPKVSQRAHEMPESTRPTPAPHGR